MKTAEQELQSLNEELAAATEELSAANEEIQSGNAERLTANSQLTRITADLDNFIYTASHDLKSPILNIEGLLKVLGRKVLPQLPEDKAIGEILEMMTTSVSRFKQTITDLTDIARIQKQSAEEPEQVYLEKVVEDVEVDLRQQILESEARI